MAICVCNAIAIALKFAFYPPEHQEVLEGSTSVVDSNELMGTNSRDLQATL